jgi:hypothetical protein
MSGSRPPHQHPRPSHWRWEETSACSTTTRRYAIEIPSSATPPDFRRRESWYIIKVLPGKLSQAQKEISDDTQRNWILPAFEAVAVDSSKVIHAIRQSIARLTDIWEVPADQINISYVFPSTVSLLNVVIDSKDGRIRTRRVDDVLFSSPAPPLYEGDNRVWIGQGNVFSTAELRNPVSYSHGEAVALGRCRRGRLRGRPRP